MRLAAPLLLFVVFVASADVEGRRLGKHGGGLGKRSGVRDAVEATAVAVALSLIHI